MPRTFPKRHSLKTKIAYSNSQIVAVGVVCNIDSHASSSAPVLAVGDSSLACHIAEPSPTLVVVVEIGNHVIGYNDVRQAVFIDIADGDSQRFSLWIVDPCLLGGV